MSQEIGKLNRQVTDAILDAEYTEKDGATLAIVTRKYLVVARIESQLAKLLPASTYEGIIARRGTVLALIKAQQWAKAIYFASKYAAEDNIPEYLVEQLAELKKEAETKRIVG